MVSNPYVLKHLQSSNWLGPDEKIQYQCLDAQLNIEKLS